MCSTRTGLLPSAALLILLAVGVHGGGIGPCNDAGGTCLHIPTFLRVAGDPFCHGVDQIALSEVDMQRECGEPDAICCKLGKVQYVGKRHCESADTPKRCKKRHGGLCESDCHTMKIDGLCKGASCTCCVQKEKKCKPKPQYKDKSGFCVSKQKHCRNAGGKLIRRGCKCKGCKNKGFLCYEEKDHDFHWSYKGDTGPEHWHDHFPLCGLDRQSPIDIVSDHAESLTADPLEFTLYNRQPINMDIKNNGHSVTCYWNNAAKPHVDKGGLDSAYILAQFHFHWGSDSTMGSEHLIDGEAYPIELHLVHYKAEYGSLGDAVKYSDGLAVLGVMFVVGQENAALKRIVDELPNIIEAGTEHRLNFDMDMSDFLPENTNSFYRYLGSLTTPSCNEVVVWTVFKEPLEISEEQLDEFRKLKDEHHDHIEDNFRPVQALNSRTISVYSS